jgi:hypothetical protein
LRSRSTAVLHLRSQDEIVFGSSYVFEDDSEHIKNAKLNRIFAGLSALRRCRKRAAKGFRRLKAHKRLSVLREALAALQDQNDGNTAVAPDTAAA